MAKETMVIKNLKIALKDFEMMVKNTKHLWNGRDTRDSSFICARMHKGTEQFMRMQRS